MMLALSNPAGVPVSTRHGYGYEIWGGHAALQLDTAWCRKAAALMEKTSDKIHGHDSSSSTAVENFGGLHMSIRKARTK